MNAPVRRLSIVVAVLFASLLVSTTLIQYVFAADLNARPDNRRTLLSTYARERGDILVGQTPIANIQISVGTHEMVFRHPQFGERKQTIVVTAKGLGGGMPIAGVRAANSTVSSKQTTLNAEIA